jgi:anti-sigma factor RsiW
MSSDQARNTENLIAYLDGELNDASAAEVEQQLAGDPALRREIEQLTRTWELLDVLPSSRASSEFTSKTMTAIRTTQAPLVTGTEGESTEVVPARPTARILRQWLLRLAGLAGLMFVAFLAFQGAARRERDPVDELLTELPVIERLDQYREVESVDFLKQLQTSGLFNGQSRRE